jgi:hypothetical protein
MTGALSSKDGAQPAPPTADELPSTPRRAAVLALVSILIVGSVIAFVRDDPHGEDLWPFSAYRMYSFTIRTWGVTTHRLFGVLREDGRSEIPLMGRDDLYPIGHNSYYFTLRRIERMRDSARLEAALRDTLSRYEARRRAGLHDGAPLQAIRLYELRWRLDPRRTPREAPDSRRLLLEVAPP